MKANLIFTFLATTWAVSVNPRETSFNPTAFFQKFNDSWFPLSEFYEHPEAGPHPFQIKKSCDIPIEITLKNHYAYTLFGNVGVFNGNLVHGRDIKPLYLELDNRMKIEKPQLYSCLEGLISVLRLDNTGESCVKGDIYLMPFDELTGNIVEYSHVSKDGANSLKGLLSVPSSTETVPIPQDKTFEFLPLDSPYVFCIKSGNTWKPLSYSTEFEESFGVFSSKSLGKPVKFTLHNKTAYTQNIPFSGYAGFINDLFVFGGSTPPTSFSWDMDMKINHSFYSCGEDENSPERLIIIDGCSNDYCYDVEVYLLPYIRTTGKP